jgi:hypothetical protein
LPCVSLLRDKADVFEGIYNGAKAHERRGSGFRGRDHLPFVVEDEVEAPKTDGHPKGTDDVVASHPDLEGDVKNVQGPYLARQLSVFRTSSDK